MSKIHTEEKEVFGILETEFGRFNLLSAHPDKISVPWYLRDMDVLSFFIQDDDGFGKNILVKGCFIIKPLSEKVTSPVHFLIDEENIKVDSLE